jgi:hypothetical protein
MFSIFQEIYTQLTIGIEGQIKMMFKKLIILIILVFPIFLSANSDSYILIPNINGEMKHFFDVEYFNLSFRQKNSFKFYEGKCSIFYSAFNENFQRSGYLYLTFSKRLTMSRKQITVVAGYLRR